MVRAQAREQLVRVLGNRRYHIDRTEPSRIDEPTRHPSSVVRVTCSCSAGGASLFSVISMRPDMPRWISRLSIAIEPHQNIFGAAPETGNARAGQSLSETDGQRPAQIGPGDSRARDDAPFQPRLHAAHHGFDLGEFRHGWLSRYR